MARKSRDDVPAGTQRTLETFRAAYDPMYGKGDPTITYARELRPDAKVFVIVAAQNATPVHADWWATLLTIVARRNAELLVVPIRYKNPTSQWSGSQKRAEHWDAATVPYLWNKRHTLHEHLTLLADIPVQPTAESPLTGAEAISLASSGIIGHTKLQLKSIPVPSGRMAKILTTTGACTVENYTSSRAGKTAEFHHSLSATIVELNGPYFHLTQLHYHKETRSCIDRGTRYYASGKVAPAPRALALCMGDTHVRVADPKVDDARFANGGVVQVTRPLHLIWADLMDGQSCNPHHGAIERYAKSIGGHDDVRTEVNESIAYVRERTAKDVQSIIQACNHNDFLRRWALGTDWKDDFRNAKFLNATQKVLIDGARVEANGVHYPDPFKHWFDAAKVPNARVLDLDEPFTLADVELSMHGDKGPNGARGSIRNLRRIGVKSVIFHSHSPGIDEGCTQAGTGTFLRLDYNHGASGWLNADVLLNDDAKRQLIIYVDGRWRV